MSFPSEIRFALFVGNDAQKENFRQNLARLGVTDEKVLRAMAKVRREDFLPREERSRAFQDAPLPIDEGQTISQPSLVAYMTQELNLQKSHCVLEIGTGSGYQTAILAELVTEVFTIEVRESLSRKACQTLCRLGYQNISYRTGDGMKGWKDAAPFDAIILTAAARELPLELIDQLKAGGRMIFPFRVDHHQELQLLEKNESGFQQKALMPVRFVPIVPKDPKLEERL